MAGMLLALDLARKTGYALGPYGENPRCQTIDLERNHVTTKRWHEPTRGRRLLTLMQWLNDFLKVNRVDEIAYEAPLDIQVLVSKGNRNETALGLFGFSTVIEIVGEARKIPYEMHDVQDVRQHFVGQRTFRAGHNALTGKKIESRDIAKMATIERCRQLGISITDDNQADAAALHSYVSGLRKPSSAMRVTPLFRESA